jgi:dienelactone hydrolase
MLGPAFLLCGDSFPGDTHVDAALRARLSTTFTHLLGQAEILTLVGEACFQRDIPHRLALLDRLVPAGEAGKRVVLMGRSSGARVISLFASRRDVAAVICLGYPFRDPDRVLEPDRFAHLARIAVPTLIVQGVDDPYGGIDLTEHFALSPSVSLKFVSGNHGLHLPPGEWDAVAHSIAAFCNGAPQRLPAFDEGFYLRAYPGVAQAVATGALASGEQHYRKYGCLEGRRFRLLPSGATNAAATPTIVGRNSGAHSAASDAA